MVSKERPTHTDSGVADDEHDVVDPGPAAADQNPASADGAGSKTHDAGRGAKNLSKKELLARLASKNDMIMDLTRDKEELDDKCKSLHDKWLRSHAEFENYRKRTQKEWELLKQQTKAEVILEFLSIVDDFERAFSAVGETETEFIQGIRLIYNNMQAILEKFGVSRIEAIDSPFDPNYHMAVAQIEKKDASPGQVVEILQQGYLLGNQVIRPAKVVIAK